MNKTCLILITIALSVTTLYAKEIKPDQTSRPIKIDGVLDDEAWGSARNFGDFQLLSSQKNSKSLKPQTSFKVITDNDNIYFGIRCEEPLMKSLHANIKNAEKELIWKDDLVELFISPDGMPDQYYQFAISAGGGKWSMYFAENGKIKPDPYKPLWDAAVFRGNDFWSAEIKIPLSAFYLTPSRLFVNTWLLNVTRTRQAECKNEYFTWSKLFGSFHETTKFNKITDMPAKSETKDLYCRSLRVILNASKPDGYVGELTSDWQVGKAAAGQYRLRVSDEQNKILAERPIKLKAGDQYISLENIIFKQLGYFIFKVELLNRKGQVVAGRRYPSVAVAYKPLLWHLSKPSYARSFFHGQNSTRIVGSVTLNIENDNTPLTVDFTLKTNLGDVLRQTVLAEKNKAVFDLKLKNSQYKSAELKAEVKQKEKLIYRDSITIKNLPKPTIGDNIYIENSRFMVNGKPHFPIWWYAPGYLVSKAFLEKYPDPTAKSAAVDKKMKKQNLEPNRLIKGIELKEATQNIKPSQELFDKIREKIESSKDKEFWIYYLCDEPECREISPVYLKYLYDYIKSLDPYHPVAIVSREPDRFLDCCDIIGPHPYLGASVFEDGRRVLNRTVEQGRRYCRKIIDAGLTNKSSFFMPGTFSSNITHLFAEYPTFDEMNASIWSAVAVGVQGIWPYIYYDHAARPDLRLGIDYIFASLRRLEDFLTSTEESTLTIKNQAGMVEGFLRHYNGSKMLLLVNVSPEPQKTIVQSPDLAGTTWRYFRGKEQIPGNKEMTFELAPYDVVILTSKKFDTDLSTLSQFRQELADAEKKRLNCGNLLLGLRRKIEVANSPMSWDGFSDTEQLDKLFDGVYDVIAFKGRSKNPAEPAWYETSFIGFAPTFKKARIYGADLGDVKVELWKNGKWISPKADVVKIDTYCTEFNFAEPQQTVRLKFIFSPNVWYEIYEIDLKE